MAYTAITYSFTPSTTIASAELNANFTDIINGLSDGTKSLNIDAITAAGTATFNGAVSLGNATGDDVTVTGYIASSLLPKTKGTPTVGNTTVWWGGLYMGDGTYYCGWLPASSPSGSYALRMPPATDIKGQGMVSSGSGVMAFAPQQYLIKAVSNDNYTILDDDGYSLVTFTGLAADKTCTLPTAADNANRKITIKKLDAIGYKVTVLGDAAGETIEGISGSTGFKIIGQYEGITVVCDGSVWHIVEHFGHTSAWTSFSPTTGGFGTLAASNAFWKKEGSDMLLRVFFNTGTTEANPATFTLPLSVNINTSLIGASQKWAFGWGVAAPNSAGALSTGFIACAYESGDTTKLYFAINVFAAGDGTDRIFTTTNGNIISPSNDGSVWFEARVPISEWAN